MSCFHQAPANLIFEIIGGALGFLADTYLHDANASYAIHLFRDALPKLNMTGDIELSSYFVGRLGEALIAAGNESEGGQLLERAHRLARQMGYRKYERLWSAALGERALAEGRFTDAHAHYSNVFNLSDKVRPSLQSAQVLCQLSKISLRLREYPEQENWLNQLLKKETGTEPVARNV